ncbi:MAG: 30S ribosomal protein S5 [Chloroflexi bacterium]|nr:30S ribosomal protein S5 [Chloroflexota bacterium]
MISTIDASELTLSDKLIYVNRVSKVVKGGKRLRFSALVVTGDSSGHVGVGVAKALEVPIAINKAGAVARKNLVEVPIVNNTIPREVNVKYGSTKVMLKPAVRGTGIIAGGSVRAVLEAAGVKDVLSKTLGSRNRINVARATVIALSELEKPEEAAARRKPAEAAAISSAPQEKVVTGA